MKKISNYILLLSFYVLIKISKNRNIEFVIQMTFVSKSDYMQYF